MSWISAMVRSSSARYFDVASICQVSSPTKRGGATVAVAGMAPISRVTSASLRDACGVSGAVDVTKMGVPFPPGNSRLNIWSTWRALAVSGSTLESVVVNLTPTAGSASRTMKRPLTMATMAGRRITKCDSRYHPPDCSTWSAASLRARQRLGARAFTRFPSRASTAGSTPTATTAAISATTRPPKPMENRKSWGKIMSAASAAPTVTALNSTLVPAVRMVTDRASSPGPVRAISSRYRDTMSRL